MKFNVMVLPNSSKIVDCVEILSADNVDWGLLIANIS